MKSVLIAGLFLWSAAANAQIVAVQGGDSTIGQNAGASAVIYLTDSTSTIGAGEENGQFHFGIGTHFDLGKNNEISLGDSLISYTAGVSGVSAAFRGIGFARKTEQNRKKRTLLIFVGAATDIFSNQYFVGYGNQYNFASGLYFSQEFSHGFTFASAEGIAGNRKTAVESGDWTHKMFHVQASGGVLANDKIFDLNVNASLKWLNLYGSRNDVFFYNVKSPNIPIRARVNSLGGSLNLGWATLHASGLQSDTNQVRHTGHTFGADIRPSQILSGGVTLYSSGRDRLLSEIATAHLTRHISVTEYFSQANGSREYSTGATWQTNRFSISAGQQILFYPFAWSSQNPFVQTLSVGLSLHIGSTTLSAATETLPTPHALHWAVGGQSWIQGPYSGGNASGRPVQEAGSDGKYEYRGICLENGKPLEGCAVLIGKTLVFSDAAGVFSLRSRHNKNLPLAAAPDEFLNGTYQIVLCPPTISPNFEVSIIVKRR